MPSAVRIPSLRIQEIDGSPDVQGVERIYVTNGFMSSLGSGAVLLSLSGSAGGSSLAVQDIDGSPNVSNVTRIYLTNGFLSDMGGGSVLLSLSGSASGAPADAEYWVETANGTLSNEVVVGTTGITTAAYASRQAAAKAGRLFLPSDGFVAERDTGSAWAPWGPIFPCTAPVDGDFAWINQGGASVSTTNGGIYLLGPATAGVSMRIRKKAAPATPYTITAMILPAYGRAGNPLAGLCWRKSGAEPQLAVRYGIYQASGALPRVQIAKMTSATVHSGANYVDDPLSCAPLSPMWLQISDDGVNRICRMGRDGQNWITLHSVGNTDFVTADEVGFFVEAGDATYDVGSTLLSWKETA